MTKFLEFLLHCSCSWLWSFYFTTRIYVQACSLYCDILQRHLCIMSRNMLKSLNFKDSSHLIFEKVFFQQISTPCWMIFCQLLINHERWCLLWYFVSLLCLMIEVWCLTPVLAIFQLYDGEGLWSSCILSNM